MSVSLPALGSVVADKYRVEALIGEGGMGAVFRARHELMDKRVALKWLHPHFSTNADIKDRFMREARAAARIKHPNVVEVFDVGVHHGSLFMVMELLEGETFEAVLTEGTMSIPRALSLLVGAMHGVAEAHERGIVHRDIKPENIFVVRDRRHPEGLAKILDFGISKLNDDKHGASGITKTGFTIGTPAYMSYEHMNGAKDVDARTDIYSFGVLLYRALTGVSPFDAETFAAVAVKVATLKPPTPKTLRTELPVSLDRVVMRAMAFDRQDRYANMTELIDALTLLASTEGFLRLMTRPGSAPPKLTPERLGADGSPLAPAGETEKIDLAPSSTGPRPTAPAPARANVGVYWLTGGGAFLASVCTAVWLLWPSLPPPPPPMGTGLPSIPTPASTALDEGLPNTKPALSPLPNRSTDQADVPSLGDPSTDHGDIEDSPEEPTRPAAVLHTPDERRPAISARPPARPARKQFIPQPAPASAAAVVTGSPASDAATSSPPQEAPSPSADPNRRARSGKIRRDDF
jgi:eukaryotic-like serine/threonine-protein kinase